MILRRHAADVVVVGAGLVGAVAARALAEGGARVLVVDAGAPLSHPPAGHLRNLAACRHDRSFYSDLLRAHLRPASLPPPRGSLLGPDVPPMPEGRGLNAAQRGRVNMPGARLTNALGGMGILWNCVAPRLHPELERWPGVPPAEWDALHERAEAMLAVGTGATAGSRRQEALIAALGARYPAGAAAPRPAPVAARRTGGGAVRWTGPAELLSGGSAGEAIELLGQHAVRRIRRRGERAVAVEAVALESREPVSIEAGAFVVAAGGLRTPALLWASGILTDDGDRSPLGRHLHDHPLAYAQVVLSPELVPQPVADGDPDPVVVVPLAEERPLHSVLLCDAYDARVLEGRVDDRLLVGLYWFALAEPRFENRVAFGSGATDAFGLPQPTFEYARTEAENARAEAALDDLRAAGELIGRTLPTAPPQILSPGSSLHVMGTTRMGDAADGSSATDGDGRVWGLSNLYLAGTGLTPCATASNPTLAACAVAIRTADRIVAGRAA